MDMELLKAFFMWSAIINMVLFTYVTLMCVALGDWIFKIHGKLFSLERKTFNTVVYSFLGFYKIVVIVFSLVPWLALLIVG